MKPFEYVNAETVEQAIEALTPGRLLKAGGIDLLDEMKAGVVTPEGLVNLLPASALRGIREEKESLTIGALTTLAELSANPTVRKECTALSEAAVEAATVEIRNMATVGGNLCQHSRCWYYRLIEFPCLRRGGKECPALDGQNKYHAIVRNTKCADIQPSNLAPALVALDATIVTNERTIAAEKFFVHPDDDATRMTALKEREIVTAVTVRRGWKSAYREIREKHSFDWALASAAVAIDGGKPRVVLGHVAAVPIWAQELDKATPLAMNAYKVALARAAIRRATAAASGKKED